MNRQPIRAIDAKTAFALARRIERALRPAVDDMPFAAELHLDVALNAPRYPRPFFVSASVFYTHPDTGLELALHESFIEHTDEIERLVRLLQNHAEQVRADA